jgi:hypothetical protein
MRKILLAATLVVAGVAGTGPGLARDYPWCARMPVNGSNPECNFDTYAQCLATISGISGTCIENPILAFQRLEGDAGYAAAHSARHGRSKHHD